MRGGGYGVREVDGVFRDGERGRVVGEYVV